MTEDESQDFANADELDLWASRVVQDLLSRFGDEMLKSMEVNAKDLNDFRPFLIACAIASDVLLQLVQQSPQTSNMIDWDGVHEESVKYTAKLIQQNQNPIKVH